MMTEDMRKNRVEYSSPFHRPPVKLPGGAKLGVWFILNIEKWDIRAAMARSYLPAPQGAQTPPPDIPNFSWFDYGLRIGFWRIKKVLDKHGIRATVSLNAPVCDIYPEMVQSMLDRDWEILAHGYEQRAIFLEEDERAVIRKTRETIQNFTGKAPRGWMGPGLHETFDTPDILAEEGLEYVADWVNDDQPYPMKVKKGRLIAVPYTVELNDILIYIIQQHSSDEIYKRGCLAFDQLYEEGAESSRIMGIAVHPYVSGAAHRIKYIDMLFDYMKQHEGVVFMTGEEILDWYDDVVGPAQYP
ncbi:MAG: polysaccharide deacetylase family protein [Deltaproteobacteria bacterium]|nr:polysaccharide deacetylase family protein [Deltaproteobacteria bacterium]MBW1943862.1 polysaccharide deacetylase family protein [Deltaproteobacteria bacterium]